MFRTYYIDLFRICEYFALIRRGQAGARGYNAKDDMWALGCILAELLTRV